VVTKDASALQPFAEIIADELNVKAVKLVELSLDSTTEFGVIKRLNVNARAAGPRIGKSVQEAIQAAKAGDWSDVDGKVVAGGIELVEGEYTLDLVANFADGAEGKPSTDLIGILPSGGFLILDSAVTPELAAEGLARDVIRGVQQARKDADFDVSDRISLKLTASADVLEAIATHAELVKSETLSLELATVEAAASQVAVGEGQFVDIVVTKL
jgi:isoleucyl-tRNA synthetase